MTPNEVAEKARDMIAGKPELEKACRDAWAVVTDAIAEHIKTSGKRWKNYETHHLTQAARLKFLTAFTEGKPLADCQRFALATLRG